MRKSTVGRNEYEWNLIRFMDRCRENCTYLYYLHVLPYLYYLSIKILPTYTTYISTYYLPTYILPAYIAYLFYLLPLPYL